MDSTRGPHRAKSSLIRAMLARVSRMTSALTAMAIVLGSAGVFITGQVVGADPAVAESTATIEVGASTVKVGVATNLGITLTGFSATEQTESYQVTLKYVDANGVAQSNGILTATKGATSLVSGYGSYSASKLGFKGTFDAVSEALASVTWTPNSSFNNLTLRIGLATVPGTNKYYDANSGHYYEYVSSGATYATAKANAKNKTYFGLNGYLVHITSRAENDFIANEMSASNIYIGATDSAVEGQWRWDGATIAGESDFVFNTYASSEWTNSWWANSSASGWGYGDWYSGRFSGWSAGEPNNWGGSEDCAVTNWGSAGQWNDISCGWTGAYLIEYGGAGGTYSGLSLTTDAVMSANDASATWTSPSSPTTATSLEFGLSFNYSMTGLAVEDFENVGTATGCTFTPSTSTSEANALVTISATGCSTGTVQPRILENSVNLEGGLTLPASSATAVTVNAGPVSFAQSSYSLSGTETYLNGPSITLSVLPRDSYSRPIGPGKSFTVSASPLAAQVTDNGNGTYMITFTPSASTGTANVSITVAGTTVSTGLTLTVGARPDLTSMYAASTVVFGNALPGIDFSDSNSRPAASYSISSGQLPAGVSLDASSGIVSGTPSVVGAYYYVVTATNKYGSSSSAENSVNVIRAPTYVGGTSSVTPKGDLSSSYRSGVNVASGAYPAPVYSVSSGRLPPGISLNPESGVLSGTLESQGSYSFAISASNSAGTVTTPALTIVVVQAPKMSDETINDSVLRNSAYNDGVSATAFPAPAYSIVSGSLPTGITLDPATGALTGRATELGLFTFAIGVNAPGYYTYTTPPLRLSVEQVPTVLEGVLSGQAKVGQPYSHTLSVESFPLPRYWISSGNLPGGMTLNETTGTVSGTPTTAGNFSFTVTATNYRGSVSMPLIMSVTAAFVEPDANIDFGVPIGESAYGAEVDIQTTGLAAGASYEIVVRSTPQVVGSGKTSATGEVTTSITIPSNLEPGWHSITLTSTATDGSTVEEVKWFEITATGILEDIRDTEPSAAEKASALTDDTAFYAANDIQPVVEATPAVVESTVKQVSSVVASVALVSAAAAAAAAVSGATAAATGASAAAGSATSAGGAASGGSAGAARAGGAGGSSAGGSSSGGSSSGGPRGGSSSGSSGSSSSGSSSNSNTSGGTDGGDGGDDAPEYSSLEAEHDYFAATHVAWGDSLIWWSNPFMRSLDRVTYSLTESTSKLSPVLSRIINDGSYLRAMLGGLMIFVYLAAAVLGAVSVNPDAISLAAAGNVAALSIILVLGTLDALAGLIGILSFSIVSISMFGITSVGDIRYLLAMFIAGFAPIILATTFRKIRRPKMESVADVWERIIDVFMIAFIASLATLSVVGGISVFAGTDVPLADAAKSLVFIITAVALGRIVLEEIAARHFTNRLDRINPTEVPGPGMTQQWASLLFKYAVLVLMIGDMVGWGWWLWVGAFILFVPGVMSLTMPNLPKSRILTQLIPGGLAALLLATLLSTWSGNGVGAWFAGSDLLGPMSFLLVPLPVILVAIIGMFAAGGEKWYVERKLTWVYVVGGIVVFGATVWATDFVGQVFG